MEITKRISGIRFKGYRGTWHCIDIIYDYIAERDVCLMEHDTYGDETSCIICSREGEIFVDDAWNGFNDYVDYMEYDEFEMWKARH